MLIKRVTISPEIAYKIRVKHGVKFEEVEKVLLTNPLIYRIKDGRYIAIGTYVRFVTVIFEYDKCYANIITDYPSSDWQIKLYKRKKGG